MSAKSAVILLAVLILVPAEAPSADLSGVKAMNCRYCSGTTVNWFAQKPEGLVIKEEFMDQLCPSIIFTNIDLGNNTVISRTGDLETVGEVWEFGRGINFLEFSYSGGVNVTTVYEVESSETGMYLSVRSEHTATSSFPIPKQFFGACQVME